MWRSSKSNQMTTYPKISIIIPVYNAETYIDKCIVSVINQNYDNIELILVDDGSKDNSIKVCTTYATRDKRIKLIHQENLGVSAARNNGIKNSMGDFIVFVDADDYLLPCAITNLYNNMLQTRCELVCGSYQMKKTRNRVEVISYHKAVYKNKDYIENLIDILNKVANAPWGKLFNAEIIRQNHIVFPEGIPYAEDTIFLLRYCRYISSLSICSEILYNYNFTDSNSAMKKFYPDLYRYFSLVLKEKENFFSEKKEEKLYASIRPYEEEYYFEWCSKHYILHTKGDNLKSLITNAALTLLCNGASGKYKKYILDQNLDIFIKKWKKEHWKEILTYNLKKLMKI